MPFERPSIVRIRAVAASILSTIAPMGREVSSRDSRVVITSLIEARHSLAMLKRLSIPASALSTASLATCAATRASVVVAQNAAESANHTLASGH
jgi:hypothetical protein